MLRNDLRKLTKEQHVVLAKVNQAHKRTVRDKHRYNVLAVRVSPDGLMCVLLRYGALFFYWTKDGEPKWC